MKLAQFSRLVRRTHMYLALFLTPWMLAYALSSLIFNHFALVRSWYDGHPNEFITLEDRSYEPKFADDTSPADAAQSILEDLDMMGSHSVRGSLKEPRLTINRQGGYVAHRIIYHPQEKRLVVDKQKPNVANFLTRVHIRHGYKEGDALSSAWALALDLVILAMGFWILSGLWMWWEIKPARLTGGLFGLIGIGLFALLLVTV